VVRRAQALRPPDEAAFDFSRFPRRSLRASTHWYRQHRAREGKDHGAWYFSSHAAGEEGDGRFDLAVPDGTCYLSSTARGAINELIGPDAAERGWVNSELVAGRVVSRLPLPRDVRVANVSAERAADFRITRELVTTVDYGLTQQWAAGLAAAGFGGILADLRFTPGTPKGLALFGSAGVPEPPWQGDPDARPVRPLVESYGIEVVDPPSFSTVSLAKP